jgi:hypothetical protein
MDLTSGIACWMAKPASARDAICAVAGSQVCRITDPARVGWTPSHCHWARSPRHWSFAAGVGAGAGASLALSRLIASQLYGVSPLDGLSYGAAALIFGVVSMAAVWAPAKRAARVDPLVALRVE